MTNQEYHDYEAAISSSKLKLLNPPALYKANPKKDTKSLSLGSAVHCLILEPEKFDIEFFVGDGRTKEAKAAKDQGLILITEQMMEDAKNMADSVMNHSYARELLSKGVAETPFFWEEPVDVWIDKMKCHYCDKVNDISGSELFSNEKTCSCGKTFKVPSVYCKIKPDFLGENYFLDVKTVQSAQPYKFRYAIKDYLYHMSAYMYKVGLEANGYTIDDFYWIAVESSYPYLVAVYTPDEGMMLEGKRIFESRLKTFRTCRDTDTWPGYPLISTISLDNSLTIGE